MADEVKCQFCDGIHGNECPEFADFPGVEGSMEKLLDVVRSWRCSGMCGKVEQTKTASALLNEGWMFDTKMGIIWAICPECGVLKQQFLNRTIEKWLGNGSPKGNN